VFYVFDSGPMSEADVPGVKKGERGIMMRFVKEDKAPVFHELTHLLAGYSDSQSLAEGFADAVDDHFRPARRTPSRRRTSIPISREKASRLPEAVLEATARPATTLVGPDIASASTGRPVVLALADRERHHGRLHQGSSTPGPTDDAYKTSYKKDLAALRADWKAFVDAKPEKNSADSGRSRRGTVGGGTRLVSRRGKGLPRS